MSEPIKVTRGQVAAARALIKLRGGEEKVDETIRRIAHAQRPGEARAG